MTPQLNAWKGTFGDEYTSRNRGAGSSISRGVRAYKAVLQDLQIGSVLEVGSNIGRNLLFLSKAMKTNVKLFAVEPNINAFRELTTKKELDLAGAWNCTAFEIPLADDSIDLVFTSGVLIHISPEDLPKATDEIVRISSRYVFCCEYFSDTPTEISYRGREGLLFKRDFGAFYDERYPQLECIRYGFWWKRDFKMFGNLNWWLFRKRKLKSESGNQMEALPSDFQE